MNDCNFCKDIATGADEIFFENKDFVVFWDFHPLTPGHAIIVPKKHVQYIDELSEAEVGGLMLLARQVSVIIKQTNLEEVYIHLLQNDTNEMHKYYYQNSLQKLQKFSRPPEAFNYGINDGPEAGQSVPHVHLHIMPRWAGDIENPRGGIRNMFASDEYSAEP